MGRRTPQPESRREAPDPAQQGPLKKVSRKPPPANQKFVSSLQLIHDLTFAYRIHSPRPPPLSSRATFLLCADATHHPHTRSHD